MCQNYSFKNNATPARRGVCQNYSFKNNATIEKFCKLKKIIICINNYSSFLTAYGAPKKRFYGDFLEYYQTWF